MDNQKTNIRKQDIPVTATCYICNEEFVTNKQKYDTKKAWGKPLLCPKEECGKIARNRSGLR